MSPLRLPANPKLRSRSEIIAVLAPLRPVSSIVFTNGCYDILHPGHVDLLQRARSMGDVLVLGLNSDESVRRLKGPTRPVNRLAERAFVLAGLECVDYIVSFDEDTPLELIKAVQPKMLIKGGDWSVENIVGRDVVEAAGGSVHSLPLLPGYSTTGLIRRLCQLGE
ncbi:D-glycero-beta-D-manno-heptose 1-phosphate adenylyltransferase [Desulfocurvibacter africanus]|uniref:D-glycero-beta-D-manno-heptose 1-phosphate adenylyltransferase n=1 Tax=Desulfocurvibacter africanus subsp. africanus str. Walvis Bay TaxID=690850 RepID=F3Z0R7_DESAF|nr:D-glycero-beta-D-manno-heptose 1-phosphate adenylyltransferase [Desulfocurvibacter africanus]EGJ49891.1 rfaE bifunctional protein [Desulfocurvibacter africanus subsp. africanus str. Walvis Bay]